MPFFVASGPTDPDQPQQLGVMIGRQSHATRDEAEAEARRGAADRAAAGFGVARTVVIEADDQISALEAAYLELVGKPLEMPDHARRAMREARRDEAAEEGSAP